MLGFTGSVGFSGVLGFTGSVGSSGVLGVAGSVGFSGVLGVTGSVGFSGVLGVALVPGQDVGASPWFGGRDITEWKISGII